MDIRDHTSSNWSPRPDGVVIDTVVLHATVLDSLEGVIQHFCSLQAGVSSHYTIDRDGTTVRHVDEELAAHHAGVSRMADGRERVNDFSIGIELVNRNDGLDPYPAAQMSSLRALLTEIRTRHPIRYLVGHHEIAIPSGRKSDPRGFDLDLFRGETGLDR